MNKDSSGGVVETIFDIVSLAGSIVDVCNNPNDPLAWAGLIGDAVDLIPCVTGVGEAVKGIRTVANGAEIVDNVTDTARIIRKSKGEPLLKLDLQFFADSGKKSLLDSSPDEIVNMTRKELKDSTPKGWDFQNHNGRIHIKDENGNFRVRIDPPDKKTKYTHIHIMDKNKNPLDINGKIVSPKDPSGHIPYNN